MSTVNPPLLVKEIESFFQSFTMAALGIVPQSPDDEAAYSRVRIVWQANSQPAEDIDEDVCFLTVVQQDDETSKIRDRVVTENDDTTVQVTESYQRVWSVSWTHYGQNSFDQARKVQSALFNERLHDKLAGKGLYLVPEFNVPKRVPEENGTGTWFERTDWEAEFNELAQEQTNIEFIESAEVLISDRTGLKADVKISKEVQ